jgi:mannitol PTS system EIIA component
MVRPSLMAKPLLSLEGIHLAATASSQEEAVARCGDKLIELGAVLPDYAKAMYQREQIFSSYMGNGVAIPHGTDESRSLVNFGQLVFLRFIEPVPWQGELVSICIGIAAREDEHVEILGNLADVLVDEESLSRLKESSSAEEILRLLTRESL